MTQSQTSLLTLRDLYRRVFLVRRAEEMLMAEYHPADQMRCPIHFCVGQEAMPAAMARVIRKADVLMSHYRSHGYYLAKGGSLDAMVAEFYGKATGSNRGIAGSMELASHENHFYSGAIVGGSLVIPLGSAFAQKYRGVDDISVCVMGDGSFDEGVTYESFNLAALYRLPLLVICENNRYAAHTPVEERLSTTALAERARVFGMPTEKLDGNDPVLLLEALERIVPAIRSGKGPHFLEIETYRHCAHVGPKGDDELKYRPPGEIEEWKKRDPVTLMRQKLAAADPKGSLAGIEAEVEKQVAGSIAAAKAAEFPDYRKMLASNWSGEYAAAARFTTETSASFEGGQSDARPGPF